MALDPALQRDVLDWVFGGVTPARPASRWISFATASPSSASAFDGPFNTRVTVSFAAANSPQQSCTNLNALSQATATAIATVVGWNLWNAPTGGSRLAYGTATANIGCASGDNVLIASGALKLTLS